MNNYYCDIFKNSINIAVVGISKNPHKISRIISEYLLKNGFIVFGVNPTIENSELDKIQIFNTLTEINSKIDIVNIFRKSEDIPDLVEDILQIKPVYVWMQQGITNEYAAIEFKKNGIKVVQDKCIMVEHSACS